jgi:ABC-type oligopeptide transport system ATPase subunit
VEDYLGTLSAIPTRKPQAVVATSAKRERGKVRGNKKAPRTRVIALDDCKVYKSREDYENGNVARVISRNARTRKTEDVDRAKIEKLRHHVSMKQEFAERYRKEHTA